MKPPAVKELARVDVAQLAAWARAIPFREWPQQHRVDELLRPAMVNDVGWHGFGAATDPLIEELLGHLPAGAVAFNRMLGCVQPGHKIDPHYDAQASEWIARVHVPLCTNDETFMRFEGVDYHMAVGTAYLVDTRREHGVRNGGTTPRIHFMFDVRS